MILLTNLFYFRRESREIEDGADRILNQVLAPRTISLFESKIEYIVNEYLGIKNENINQLEQNGLFIFL